MIELLFWALGMGEGDALQEAPTEERPQAPLSGAGAPAEAGQAASKAVTEMIQRCEDFFMGEPIDGKTPVWSDEQTRVRDLLYTRIHKTDLLLWFQDLKRLFQFEEVKQGIAALQPFKNFYFPGKSRVGTNQMLRYAANLFYVPPLVRAPGVHCPEDYQIVIEPKTKEVVNGDTFDWAKSPDASYKFHSLASPHTVVAREKNASCGSYKKVKLGIKLSDPMGPAPEFLQALAVSGLKVFPGNESKQEKLFRSMKLECDLNDYVVRSGGEGIIVPMVNLHKRYKVTSPTDTNLYAYSPYMHLGDYEEYLVRQKTEGTDHKKTIQLFVKILEKVAALHQIGVIHRDLKPNNVMLMPGKVKGVKDDDVLDARLIDLGKAHKQSTAKLALANINYTAPEAIYFSLMSKDEARAIGLENIHRTFSSFYSQAEQGPPRNFAYQLAEDMIKQGGHVSIPRELFQSNIKTDAWAVGIVWLEAYFTTNTRQQIHDALCMSKSIEKFCLGRKIKGWRKQVTCGLLNPNPAERMSVEAALACIPSKYRTTAAPSEFGAGAAAGAGGGDATAGAGASMQLRRFG